MNIDNFKYELPSNRIALYPLENRDHAKLLIYQNHTIEHDYFYQLTHYIPSESTLFFNDSKVIPARLVFKKNTGAVIEVFLLNPVAPSTLVSEAMQAQHVCRWKVAIKHTKRWNNDPLVLPMPGGETLTAEWTDRQAFIVTFHWSSDLTFYEIITLAGATPLPPYLKRQAEASDRERYQTIYCKHAGAVAAPTSGLHFTERVFQSLQNKNVRIDFLTLHISAGTFQPIKTENIEDHLMHEEQIEISQENISNLYHLTRSLVAVGTTTLRTLESIYWYGVMLQTNPEAKFYIDQHYAYQNHGSLPSRKQSFENILTKMKNENISRLSGYTSIYILPGYEIKTADALITNFHQPSSTLLLLIAAMVGEDWKKIYTSALANNYRFLSFGDSSLIFKKKSD